MLGARARLDMSSKACACETQERLRRRAGEAEALRTRLISLLSETVVMLRGETAPGRALLTLSQNGPKQALIDEIFSQRQWPHPPGEALTLRLVLQILKFPS